MIFESSKPPGPRRFLTNAQQSSILLQKRCAITLLSIFILVGVSSLVQLSWEHKESCLLQPQGTDPSGPTDSPFASSLCPEGIPSLYKSTVDTNEFIQKCIEPDFAIWAEKPKWTSDDVNATASQFASRNKDTVGVVEIKDNTFKFIDRHPDCKTGCNIVMVKIMEVVRKALREGRLTLPDCVFVLNVHDFAKCPVEDQNIVCKAPILSINRRRDIFTDILIPTLQMSFEVHSAPWQQKRPIAFFRGTPFCSGDPHMIQGRPVVCSRIVMQNYTTHYPELLNATITGDVEYGGTIIKGTVGPWTPIQEHANYQMLLNLDGFTASYRFGQLLAINSVVLKQQSEYEEHFYRVVKPCVHYLPFWTEHEEDVLDVVRRVQKEPKTAQAIAANAQAFAMMHLNIEARLKYFEMVVRKYASLMNRE